MENQTCCWETVVPPSVCGKPVTWQMDATHGYCAEHEAILRQSQKRFAKQIAANEAKQRKPNYGPVYAAAMYPELAGIFQAHGYALAVHGSLARDFDLIAVPWADAVADKETVLKAVEAHYAVNILRDFQEKNHGRIAYTLSVGWGECAIDLSFLPNNQNVSA